jgi:hypothetical protein
MSRSRFGYMSPGGEFFSEPAPGFLRRRLFEVGERYTARNRGAVWLAHHSWADGDTGGEWLRFADRPALIVFASKPHGFFVGWSDNGLAIRWCPYDSSAAEEVVEHTLDWGMRVATVPVACFIPPEAAWEVVEEFCRSGERSGRVRWSEVAALAAVGLRIG